MKKTLLMVGVLFFVSCEKEVCPEGTFEWNDGQGNLIDCIDPTNRVDKFLHSDFVSVTKRKPKLTSNGDVVTLNN